MQQRGREGGVAAGSWPEDGRPTRGIAAQPPRSNMFRLPEHPNSCPPVGTPYTPHTCSPARLCAPWGAPFTCSNDAREWSSPSNAGVNLL
eukprot:scaffold3300_cov97-Isochrysis_galbana.AAC.1